MKNLKCDFSTTSSIEELISIGTLMDTFKSYFKYKRVEPICGIEHFYGNIRRLEITLSKNIIS